jgi:hypothetical protein
MKKILFALGFIVSFVTIALFFITRGSVPESVTYGVTFSTPYAEEIGLNWREAYRATLDDLGVRHLRIPVYWDRVEKVKDSYDWSEIDFQIDEAERRGADVILAIGRRVPRWPECHVPGWAQERSWEEQKVEVRGMVRATVERYKGEKTISMWQVENEPYLRYFADGSCGEFDEEFLHEEIALVHSLDNRPIMQTDGGNFGTWIGAYRAGDVFGTSMYLYFWRPDVGAFRTILPPAYYHGKSNLMRLLFADKSIILSELSLEPWLAAHINDVSIDEQISRMNIEKMEEIIDYARESPFGVQYLWGVEWWYWMKLKGHPEFWEFGKKVF